MAVNAIHEELNHFLENLEALLCDKNGIPEYEKAYKYFSLAAFSGNVEARYKIGDMYKNGYYLEKNLTIAKTIYDSLYREVIQEFYHDPNISNKDNNTVAMILASEGVIPPE